MVLPRLGKRLRDLVRQRLDAVDLVAAVNDLPVDRDVDQRAANRLGCDPALKVLLRIEGRDFACVGVRVSVQKPHLVAVRQEHEGNSEQLRVVPTLVLGGDRLDARALGLDHRHRSPGAVA